LRSWKRDKFAERLSILLESQHRIVLFRVGVQDAGRRNMKYTVIIEQGRESGYVVYAPALRGCVSQGKTKEEALANIKEAISSSGEMILLLR